MKNAQAYSATKLTIKLWCAFSEKGLNDNLQEIVISYQHTGL